MAKAIIKINGEEFPIEDEIVTIGRASDNKISLAHDSNVSRYHAEVENRNGEFWLIDLGSSNGTKLNGNDVKGEILLENGDRILLGGTSETEFCLIDDTPEKNEEKNEDSAPTTATETSLDEKILPVGEAKKSSNLLLFLIAGIIGVFAILAIGAAILF